MPRMRWRVVCGFGVTMLSGAPISAFNSVDLPTFGRPIKATWPKRCVAAAGSLIAQRLFDRRERQFCGGLFRAATGRARSRRADGERVHAAFDLERLGMIIAATGDELIGRQREAACLQMFLQPRLRILR